jgi:uncharacterized iron-regulated membrane protein
MQLRTLIFWPHLIAGVIAGVLILTMSITGVILTYERQLIAWSDSHLRSTPPAAGAPRLEVEALLTQIRREHPELQVTGVTMGSAVDATAVVAAEGGSRHFDIYTGQLLGESATGMRTFMSDMRVWHRYIGVAGDNRPLAKAISGWANDFFAFIVLSGIYLWFPRKWTWQHVRPVVWFKGGLRGKARDFNWHNAIGMWSAVPLFIVVVSAVPISFRWASDAVYRAVGEEPPAPAARGGGAGARAGGAGAPAGGAGSQGVRGGGRREGAQREAAPLDGLNALWTRAEQQVPGWRTINLRIPASERAPVVFAIDKGDGGQPQHRSTLTLARQSGDVVTFEDFSSLSLGRRIRNVMRFAHTGEVLGIPGQTIAGLVSAGGVVLVWTGIALTLRRFNAWRARRRQRPEAAATRDATAA